MEQRGAEIVRLAQTQMKLPQHLRTDHWYNDWQHAVFIITFDHLAKALHRGNTPVAERLIDKLTVYLFVHFACEEEGMAWAHHKGLLAADKMSGHQGLHLRFLDYWHDAIQRPFKTGELTGRRLALKIQDFYEKVLQHIDDDDQTTYGAKTGRSEGQRMDEVAHVAASGLPLSPNSPGSLALVGACSQAAYGLLRRETLPLQAIQPLRRLELKPAGIGIENSVRSRILRVAGGHGEVVVLRRAA